jgi:hypothetical protein
MKNNVKIAQAMLDIWPNLGNYCKGLDRQIYKKAVSSYTNPNATMQIIESIIELVTRKDILQTLLHEMEANVDGLPAQEREILRRFYFTKQTTAREFAAQMGIPLRSFYRRAANAVELFSMRLDGMGVNAFTWEHLVQTNPWIKTVFDNDGKTV